MRVDRDEPQVRLAGRLAAGRLTVIDASNVQPEARSPLVALAREFRCLPVALVADRRGSGHRARVDESAAGVRQLAAADDPSASIYATATAGRAAAAAGDVGGFSWASRGRRLFVGT